MFNKMVKIEDVFRIKGKGTVLCFPLPLGIAVKVGSTAMITLQGGGGLDVKVKDFERFRGWSPWQEGNPNVSIMIEGEQHYDHIKRDDPMWIKTEPE